MGNFIIGAVLGAGCTMLYYEMRGRHAWHQIGRTMQYMKRQKTKILDGDELTTEISEN